MPILTVEGKCHAAWNESAQRKLQTYSLSECLSNLQLTRGSLKTKSKQNNDQLEAPAQGQSTAVPDAALELRKHVTSKQATALGPVGGFDVLAKHWESYLQELKPVKSDRRVTQFTSLFSHVSRYSYDDTISFVGACIHGLLSGYTVVVSGMHSERTLVDSLITLLRSTALNDLSRFSLSISEAEARSGKFWEKLEQVGVYPPTCSKLDHIHGDSTAVDEYIDQLDSTYNPNVDAAVIGHMGANTLQVNKLLADQGLADTGVTEEYRFTTIEELNKKNHQPPVTFSINLSTNAILVSSIVDLLVTLFRTKSYQKELTERLRLIKQMNDVFLLSCTGNSILQNIWQHLLALAMELMAQYLHLNNLKISDLLQKRNGIIDFQNNETKPFTLMQISRLIEFLPSILSKKAIKDNINDLLTVLPCVKLPRHVHIQLDCSGLPMQTLISNSRQPSLTTLLTLLLAIPQVTVSIKQSSLDRIRVLSASDHSRFRIKYIQSLSLSPLSDTHSSAILEINEKARNAMSSINENALIQKAIKESAANNEIQDVPLFRALEIEGNSSKNVTDRNVAQIGIILNHLSVKSKARITLRNLLELQEQKMRTNGHSLKSTELATDSDSVSIDELKESLLDTAQNKHAIILAGQTIESILAVFMDTESVLDGGIQKLSNGSAKTRLESPLKRTQDCDVVGLYIVCTYTGVITLLDMMDAQV